MSPAYVQQQLGHASIDLTVRVYGSAFPAKVPGAVDALAQSFTGSPGHQTDTQAALEAAQPG